MADVNQQHLQCSLDSPVLFDTNLGRPRARFTLLGVAKRGRKPVTMEAEAWWETAIKARGLAMGTRLVIIGFWANSPDGGLVLQVRDMGVSLVQPVESKSTR